MWQWGTVLAIAREMLIIIIKGIFRTASWVMIIRLDSNFATLESALVTQISLIITKYCNYIYIVNVISYQKQTILVLSMLVYYN
jgi:hypothetical protein